MMEHVDLTPPPITACPANLLVNTRMCIKKIAFYLFLYI